jgi:hypothetical protein
MIEAFLKDISRIAGALESLAGAPKCPPAAAATAGAEQVSTPRKRTTAKDTTPAPAPTPAPVETPPEDDFLGEDPVTEAKTYTKDQVRELLVGVQKAAGNPEQARKLLGAHGAKSLSDLKPENYAAIAADAEKFIAASTKK